ncbi:MAG TPA: deoxyribose-phosphate aldolase [Candidatus Melainabacteria bacterium]|nr:deoxyribose-phosphate aldolase [Candidatus Melainabacteria bacterium]
MANDLAKYIDHTLLSPNATPEQISRLCKEAKENSFFAVCVNPFYVGQCIKELRSSKVRVATVIGFPLGQNLMETKVEETRRAIKDGAHEIDMVINVGALKAGDIVVKVAGNGEVPVKVIIECDLLTDEEKIAATEACIKAGAFMVKTSTGFVKEGKGATVEDITLMKKTIGNHKLEIKASAGIRDAEKAIDLVKAGATRLGTSAGAAILQGATTAGASY